MSEITSNEKQSPGYGELLSKEIRMTTQDDSKRSFFEKFVLDHGYLFKMEEKLQAGYDRYWKAIHEIMITAEEFAAEVKSRKRGKELDVSDLYEVLSGLVREEKLTASDVYQYAVHGWCLQNPEAIVAYEEEGGK